MDVVGVGVELVATDVGNVALAAVDCCCCCCWTGEAPMCELRQLPDEGVVVDNDVGTTAAPPVVDVDVDVDGDDDVIAVVVVIAAVDVAAIISARLLLVGVVTVDALSGV